jgi:hypothetical protein
MTRSVAYATRTAPAPATVSLKSVPATFGLIPLLLLSSALLAANAAAQTPSWPIANGRHLQPTQQQIDSRENNAARQRDRAAQSQVDRIFDELTRDAAPRKR